MADNVKHQELIKITLLFYNESTDEFTSKVVSYLESTYFKEVLEDAYKLFEVESIAPIERWELVEFDSSSGKFGIAPAYVCEQELLRWSIGRYSRGWESMFGKTFELVLQIRDEEIEYCYVHHLTRNFKLRKAISVQAHKETSLKEFKKEISETLNLDDCSTIIVALRDKEDKKSIKILQDDDEILNTVDLYKKFETFVTSELEESQIKTAIEDNDFDVWKISIELLDKLPVSLFNLAKNAKFESDEDHVYQFFYIAKDGDEEMEFSVKISQDIALADRSFADSDENFEDPDENFEDPDENFEDPDENVEDPDDKSEDSDKIPHDFDGKEENCAEDNDRKLIVTVDSRMSVKTFFKKMECCLLDLSHESLLSWKEEDSSLNQVFNERKFHEVVKQIIWFGRPLQEGEVGVKVLFLDMNDDSDDLHWQPFVCNYIVNKSAEIGKTKRELLEHVRGIKDEYSTLRYETTRLRLKGYNEVPSEILLDDQKFKKLENNQEIIIQKLPSEEARKFDCDGQPISKESRLFVIKRFFPSELKVSKWEEIIVGKDISDKHIKEVLSKHSGIPITDIKYGIADTFLRGTPKPFLDEIIEKHALLTEDGAKFELQVLDFGKGIIYKNSSEVLPGEKSIKAFRRPFTAGR